MSEIGSPEHGDSEQQSTSFAEHEQLAHGLTDVLVALAEESRRRLSQEPSLSDVGDETRSPNPLYGVKIGRNTTSNELDHSVFEPDPGMAELQDAQGRPMTGEALMGRLDALQEVVQGLLNNQEQESGGTPVHPSRGHQTVQLSRGEDEEYLDLGLALRNVKSFDGNEPGKLDEFILSCEAVWEMIRPRQRPTLLALIRSGKLEDRATREMKHKNIGTLADLKYELEALYGKRESLAALQYEFCQLRQGPKESVSTYSTRVERLTVEVIEKLCERVGPEGAPAIETATRWSAQMNFENGLNERIQTIVRSRNYLTLHDSVVGALEVEKMVGSHSEKGGNGGGRNPRQSLSAVEGTRGCFTCGSTGHLARDCSRKSGRRSLPVPTSSQQVNQVEITCHFCGKTGHVWKDCRKRQHQRNQKWEYQGEE